MYDSMPLTIRSLLSLAIQSIWLVNRFQKASVRQESTILFYMHARLMYAPLAKDSTRQFT